MDQPLCTTESIKTEICELEALAHQAAQSDSEDDKIALSLFLQLIARRRRMLEEQLT